MNNKTLGILGATSFVGERLLALLQDSEWQVLAFSRQQRQDPNWRSLSERRDIETISNWICVAPIWVLPEYFPMLEQCQVRRIVAVSSTSRFTKNNSSDLHEQEFVSQLIQAEEALQAWAEAKGVEWLILRPTLIYGYGRDKNISEIARFIKRFRFFPVFGSAQGLRQPIHVDDVTQACLSALKKTELKNKAFNISGAEVLTYKDMVIRIFTALNRQPRLIMVPMALFKLAVAFLRLLPRYRHWTAAMAERMNQDLVFEHSEAERDLDFSPRSFNFSDTLVRERTSAE